MDPNTDVRKHPRQQRSKQRVHKILSTAETLIIATGANQLKMSDIAKQAQIPIGSLYQYFPNRSSIIRSLVEQYSNTLRGMQINTLNKIGDITTLAQAISAIHATLDLCYNFYHDNPALQALWRGLQADHLLSEIEIQDTIDHAKRIYKIIKPTLQRADEDYAKQQALLMSIQINAVIRFTTQLDKSTGDKLIHTLKKQLNALIHTTVQST